MIMELTDNMLALVSIILVLVSIIMCKIADDGDSTTVKSIAVIVLIATSLCVTMVLVILTIRNGYTW